jgi:uncharacterized protein YbjQ (UPF0145 family)
MLPEDDSPGQEAQDSLARVEAGQIPLTAERRLAELGGGGAFTSDLSINGFALCRQLGLTPLSQVMGSSIYQMGYQTAWGQGGQLGGLGLGGTFMVELDTLSRALNEVRSRALARLAEEAARLDADAVVEVKTSAGESELESGTLALEHTVFGTAVRRSGRRAAQPVLSELSVADLAKLVWAGFEPVGIVAWSSVFFAGYAFGAGIGGGELLSLGTAGNYELPDFTRAFYEARETVMEQLGAQAASLGASGIVGMNVSHHASARSLATGIGSRERSGLMVTFTATGTAVSESATGSAAAPEAVLDLLA